MKNQTLTRLTLFFVLLGGPSLSIDVMESSTSNTKIETRPATSAKLDVIDKAKPRAAYSNLPLSFEVNQGQTDAKVKFLSRGKGYSLFLTANEAVLKLAQPKPDGKGQRTLADGNKENQETAKTGSVLRMNLVGSNSYLQVSGLEELPGKRNYFIGSDPKKWRANIPTYAKVKYQNVYPGVDLIYYGNQRELEYDFVVSPGADARTITLRFEGAEQLELDAQGKLALSTVGGQLLLDKPKVYQELAGVRQEIAGDYLLKANNEVTFVVGGYDPQRPLIIDPVLVYSTYLGGSNDDNGPFGIAVDAAGSAYLTSSTDSADFPTTVGAFDTSFNGGFDAFVTKLNPTGTSLVYSTYLGGSGNDAGLGIAVDAAGDAYLTGQTSSTNFPTTVGAFDTSFNGGIDAFVTKLNPTGTSLIYSTYLGGSDDDPGRAIAIDAAGSAYLTSYTRSADFPITLGAFDTSFNGDYDTFVTKLNPTGTSLVYSTYLGGSSGDQALGIAVDAAGNTYVTGLTLSADFPTTLGSFNGILDAFVTKLSPTGTSLVYSTYLGGSNDDRGHAIAVDAAGNAYVTGLTFSADFPTTLGAFDTSFNGDYDVFVTKLNLTGTSLLYSTYLGGSGGDQALGIAVDAAGNAYLTGLTLSVDFPTTVDAFDTSFNGGFDAIVTKLDSTGSALLYSTYLGGSNDDRGHGIAVDAVGSAYVTGLTSSVDFPTTVGAFDTSFNGGSDAFVIKIGESKPPLEHSTVYVADTGNHRIQRSIDDGATWTPVGFGPGTGLGQFRAPTGVEPNSTNTIIFVADTGNNRLQRSTNGGLTWQVIAGPGTAIGQVSGPSGLAFDEVNDKLYVADTGNNRIQIATSAGSSASPTFAIFAGATAGTSVGHFHFPTGVAVDAAGLVYVSDTGNHRIQKNGNGTSSGWGIFAGATAGTAVGKMNSPTGIYVDSTNRVYVADTGNSRIQINTGGTATGWSVFMTAGSAAGFVRYPGGVVLAASQNVFVGDTGNSRVQKKPVGGGPAIVVGGPGTGPGQFRFPTGVR